MPLNAENHQLIAPSLPLHIKENIHTAFYVCGLFCFEVGSNDSSISVQGIPKESRYLDLRTHSDEIAPATGLTPRP